MRVLNDAALEYRETEGEMARERLWTLLDALHGSVDRMGELAGKTADDEPLPLHELRKS